MRLPPNYQLSQACARSKKEREDTPILANVHLRRGPKKSVLTASNGKIGLVVTMPTTSILEDEDMDGPVPIECVEAVEKRLAAQDEDDPHVPQIVCGEKDAIAKVTPDETLIVTRDKDLYPDVAGVIRTALKRGREETICVKPALLVRLAKAMGVEAVTLTLCDDAKATIVVRPAASDPCIVGILAQYRADEQPEEGEEEEEGAVQP